MACGSVAVYAGWSSADFHEALLVSWEWAVGLLADWDLFCVWVDSPSGDEGGDGHLKYRLGKVANCAAGPQGAWHAGASLPGDWVLGPGPRFVISGPIPWVACWMHSPRGSGQSSSGLLHEIRSAENRAACEAGQPKGDAAKLSQGCE